LATGTDTGLAGLGSSFAGFIAAGWALPAFGTAGGGVDGAGTELLGFASNSGTVSILAGSAFAGITAAAGFVAGAAGATGAGAANGFFGEPNLGNRFAARI
jgi:hypothetical protein